VKNIGKPYAGKPLVRFDEGGLGNQSPTLPLRYNETKSGKIMRLIKAVL
jgi:hypothetical protein